MAKTDSSKKKKAQKDKAPPSVVSIVVKEPDPSVDPVVVSFPSGAPQKPKFAWKPLNDKRPKNGRIVVGSDETCIYQAQNQGRDGRRTKLGVGIYDKHTKTLTIHQAAQRGTVYALTQSVPSYNDKQEDESTTKLTAVERRRVLFESFGSAKKRRVLKSQQANVVNVDSLVAGSMDALLPSLKMSESNRKAMEETQRGNKPDAVEAAYAEARKKFLPRFDIDAKEAHLVYDARDMAGDDAWGQVSRVVDACLHNEESENWIHAVTNRGRWADCIVDLLKTIPSASPHAKYQVKCAVLLNQLVKFHNQVQHKRRLRGTEEELCQYLHIPMEATSRFLELFATPILSNSNDDSGGYACSKQNLDKCRVHMLLLYLMAHGQSMKAGDISPLVSDVKMEVTEAANLMRAAGCKVSKRAANVWSAALTVPLTFPQPKRTRGKS